MRFQNNLARIWWEAEQVVMANGGAERIFGPSKVEPKPPTEPSRDVFRNRLIADDRFIFSMEGCE